MARRPRADLARQILGDQRQQLVEMRVDDAADDLERQPFGRRIHGEHAALRGAASSSPRLTNSRGCSWRPWKKRTLPVTSSTSPLSIVRSRKGWPGHDTSIIPVSSLSTAWKIRSPLRVGSTPFETTRPMTVPCIPVSSDAIGETVLASSYRCGM